VLACFQLDDGAWCLDGQESEVHDPAGREQRGLRDRDRQHNQTPVAACAFTDAGSLAGKRRIGYPVLPGNSFSSTFAIECG
jgi:hypothetical protein